jgi:hypothetical protein
MRLHVKPMEGWGWYDSQRNAVEVPPPFELEAEPERSEHFLVLGQCERSGHPLSGLWIRLSRDKSLKNADCNLATFAARPTDLHAKSDISGFAEVTIL